jgi:hypothetical protein
MIFLMDFICFRSKNGYWGLSGWRRAAYVNSGVLVVMTITMASCLATSVSKTKNINKTYMFFEGTCDGGSAVKLNVALYLLLNIVSTAVFASSNFFMQVLNAPSRQEIYAAHRAGAYLGIGVPSARNALRVSRFKMLSWIVLLLFSIPLHLLFNSMIFQTNNRTSDYWLTIASADFVNAAQYYAPGASLTSAGFYIFDHKSLVDTGFFGTKYNWGYAVWIGNYEDPNSDARKNISAAATNGASWDKISAADCYNIYAKCSGLTTYRNIILVADTSFSWVRDELWDLEAQESENWDPMVPGNESNSLCHSASCTVSEARSWHDWYSAMLQIISPPLRRLVPSI